MKFFDSVLNAFLSREQRERVSRSNWDKSVAQAALELGLESKSDYSVPRTPYTSPAPSCPASPRMHSLKLNTGATSTPVSYPMTPSLSSTSTVSNSSCNGISSPTRSRPSTSYSTSPRPEFRRHLSIAREPISYDALIAETPEKPRKSIQETVQRTHQLLYPLPPLGPMEGIGKYRRSVDVSDDYLDTLQRNTIAALQPFVVSDEQRVSRFRRDTTTPPRATSTSPSQEEISLRQVAMQQDLERWTQELDEVTVASPSGDEIVRINSRPMRVATKRRTQNSRERGRATRVRSTRQQPQPVSGISRNLKKNSHGGYKPKGPPPKRQMDMSASMETLLSGEE